MQFFISSIYFPLDNNLKKEKRGGTSRSIGSDLDRLDLIDHRKELVATNNSSSFRVKRLMAIYRRD